jgi:hypothetical protein
VSLARPLLDYADPVRNLRTVVARDIETGLPVIKIRQDTADIIEANKQASAAFDPYLARRSRAGINRVASLPAVVVMQLREAKIWDDEAALMKWLDQPENRHFRTDGGRRLA